MDIWAILRGMFPFIVSPTGNPSAAKQRPILSAARLSRTPYEQGTGCHAGDRHGHPQTEEGGTPEHRLRGEEGRPGPRLTHAAP